MHKGHETQIKKFGGEKGYRAEMRRRRSFRKPTPTRVDLRELRELAARGMSQKRIGNLVGVSQAQVNRLIKKHGI